MTNETDTLYRQVARYAGPVNLDRVSRALAVISDTEWEQVDLQADTGLKGRLIDLLNQFVHDCPRSGAAGLFYPIIQDALSAYYEPAEPLLILLPQYDRASLFLADTVYWRYFAVGTSPYVFDLGRGGLVPRDEEHPLRDMPIPCPIAYPAQRENDPFTWAGAIHEIGHHVYSACYDNEYIPRGSALYAEKVIHEIANSRLLASAVKAWALNDVQLNPKETASGWAQEFYADCFAYALLGPAYAIALRKYVPPERGRVPSPGLRLQILRLLASDEDIWEIPKSLPEELSSLCGALPDQTTTQLENALWSPETFEHVAPAIEHPEADMGRELYDVAKPLLDDAVRIAKTRLADERVKRVVLDLSCVSALVRAILDYVPPFKRISSHVSGHGDRTFSVEPASIGSILFAGLVVAELPCLAGKFAEPWGDEGPDGTCLSGKPMQALSKLLIKAVEISSIERLITSGSNRQRNK